jgi:hypothetical protein
MTYQFFPDGTLRMTSNSDGCAKVLGLHREVLAKYRFLDKTHILIDGSSTDVPSSLFYEVEVGTSEMRLSQEGKPPAVLVVGR